MRPGQSPRFDVKQTGIGCANLDASLIVDVTRIRRQYFPGLATNGCSIVVILDIQDDRIRLIFDQMHAIPVRIVATGDATGNLVLPSGSTA